MVEWFFLLQATKTNRLLNITRNDCFICIFLLKAKGSKNLPFTNDTFSNVFIDILLHNQFP
jgi:hypothetical protein